MASSVPSTQRSALHIGTAGWNYKEWAGSLYPEGMTDSKAMLSEYVKHFNTVELDSTFYGIPRATTVADWQTRTPAGFTFAAKFPRIITHDKKLFDAQQETNEFLTTMAGLGPKLGPLVLQFAYGFKPSDENFTALENYLNNLPPTSAELDGGGQAYRYVVEVRHKGWLNERLYNLLRFHNIALALTSSDAPWMPRYMDEASADFIYIRWLGDADKPIEYRDRSEDLKGWADIALKHLAAGRAVWGYFNNQWAGYSPGSAADFLALLNPETPALRDGAAG